MESFKADFTYIYILKLLRFKEPTITPSAQQVQKFGLKKALGSPNGAMRKGWNGITISRDTIHIEGVKLGFEKPVFFERHAVGGEYG